MSSDEGGKTYEFWRGATEKFDYFLLGGTGALCAFVAEKMKFGRIGLTPQTLELVALLFLIFSVAAGIFRIQHFLKMIRINAEALKRQDRANELTDLLHRHESAQFRVDNTIVTRDHAVEIATRRSQDADELLEPMQEASRNAKFWQIVRNGALGLGFLLLIAARVWAPYVS